MKPAMPQRLRPLVAACLAGWLSACSLIPQHELPPSPVAAQWPVDAGAVTAGAAAAADLPWQRFVQDDQLRELIALALDGSRDLRSAVLAIEQSRAQYQIRRADEWPTVNASGNASRSAPNAYAAIGGPRVASTYTVGVGLSAWEIDFFGRIDALKEAALAQYLATTEARKSAQISLIAAVSSAWLQLKTDTALLALAERTLATREQSLKLTQLRLDNGASSALDLRQAQSLAATARATRAQQQRLRARDITLLALRGGQPLPERLFPAIPGHSDPAAPGGLPAFNDVPAGLPSDLLLRRPDIRAAEQQLVAAEANIGAARAAFFPRITLTASLGRISTALDGLFGSGGAGSWSFVPGVTLPIFDNGRNQANLESAEVARALAVTSYERTVQTAFREVSDALAGRATYAEQIAAMEAQAKADRDRFRLSDLRYRNGIASYLDQLDAERSLFATEQQLAQLRLAQRANEVQLYKALGGGWTEPDAPMATAGAAQRAP